MLNMLLSFIQFEKKADQGTYHIQGGGEGAVGRGLGPPWDMTTTTLHDSLVDEETWGRANASIGRVRPQRDVMHKDDHVHRLKGMLLCGDCGTRMTPYPSGKKDKRGRPYLYYSCTAVTEDGKESRCAVRSLPVRQLESLLTRAMVDLGNNGG